MVGVPGKLRSSANALVWILVTGVGGGCSGRTAHVNLEYTLQPDHPEILDTSGPPVRVCVAKVDVDWNVDERNAGSPFGQTIWSYTFRDASGNVASSAAQLSVSSGRQSIGRLWEDAIRTQIASLLEQRARAADYRVELVSRDELDQFMRERDLALADLVDGDRLSERARLLPIDAYVFATVSGKTTLEKSFKRMPGATALNLVPYVGGVLAAEAGRPKQRIRRVMTFSGSLRLADARTSRVWLTHDISGQRIEDKKAYPFGDDATEMDLIPEEQEILTKLDSELRRFVGRMIPSPVSVEIRVKSSSSKSSRAGAAHLAANSYAEAVEAFKTALAEDPDDCKSLFGAGVACELLGRLEEAAAYYSKAVAMRGNSRGEERAQYEQALVRARERIARSPLAGRRGPSLQLVSQP